MITVFGEGRGFRVVWLLEEMGLSYRLRPVDMLAGVENDPEFLAINPGGFIPAIRDGDVTMVESIAIMEYLMGRYGPTPLAPAARDPAFLAYQQFLHLGEAGLATPALVTRQLARAPYMAGDAFTAADISVFYALQLGQNFGGIALGEAELAYMARLRERDGHKRALETCQATKAWLEQASGQ